MEHDKQMMEHVVTLVREERLHQVRLGFTTEHDDQHGHGELADAAACIAATCHLRGFEALDDNRGALQVYWDLWPWDAESLAKFKEDRKQGLIIAAALLMAEIERLTRLEAQRRQPALSDAVTATEAAMVAAVVPDKEESDHG